MIRSRVVIVHHGGRSLLEECLGSLLAHADPSRDEVVVVMSETARPEDGRLEAAHPSVHFDFAGANLGYARAANRGAEGASSRFLLFLNSDTVMEEDVITPLAAALEADSALAIAGPRLVHPDGTHQSSTHGFPTALKEVLRLFPRLKSRLEDAAAVRRIGERVERARPSHLLARYTPADRPRRVPEVTGACILIRRDVFEEVGGFDPRFFLYLEEADLCWRAGRRGYGVLYVPGARLVHRLHGASAPRGAELPDRVLLERYRSLFLFYRKNRGSARCLLLRALLSSVLAARLVTLGWLALFSASERRRARRELRLWRLCAGIASATARGPAGDCSWPQRPLR